jgi:NAD(P)-dependent dehydrogenase (short-subunit alcohol dehydrogenase family)
LDGRVALVTGGGRGVGRAVALALAARGAAVAVLARTAGQVEAVAGEIAAAGGRGLAVAAGVDEAAEAVARVEASLGPVDVLVNNAGVIDPVAPLWRTDPVVWLESLTINLGGPYLMARAVVPGMVGRGWGRIVNVSSGAARGAVTGWSAYCAAKAGLDHLTRVLAAELAGQGVSVNAVYPGLVDSAMQARIRAVPAADFGAANAARFRGFLEQGRLRSPAVPATLIAWLVAEAGPEVTGQIVSVDDPEYRQRAGLDL